MPATLRRTLLLALAAVIAAAVLGSLWLPRAAAPTLKRGGSQASTLP